MKKISKSLSFFLMFIFIIITCSANVFAETVYVYNGISYTKIDDNFVSVFDFDDSYTELVIPDSINEGYVSEIGEFALQNDTYISSIDLSNAGHLNTLGMMCFNGCTNLSGSLYIPYLITDIRMGAFQNCTSLESVDFSARTNVIPEVCFNRCTSLQKVSISQSVTTIERFAFSNCTSLSEIYIPNTVTDIHYTAFYYDDNLVIYCYTGSYAQQFAIDRGYDYVLLDAPVSETFLQGDVNGDGEVSISDVTLLQRIVANMVEPDVKTAQRADADLDGDISVQDATLLQRYASYYETGTGVGVEYIEYTP